MEVLEIILTILEVVASVALILVVLFGHETSLLCVNSLSGRS